MGWRVGCVGRSFLIQGEGQRGLESGELIVERRAVAGRRPSEVRPMSMQSISCVWSSRQHSDAMNDVRAAGKRRS